MALQKRDTSTEKTGLEYICETAPVFGQILYGFRECHDLCVQSGLFDEKVILQIDQCAVDFRYLSLDTVTAAKRVSTQWLDEAIDFFENIDDEENPAQALKILGNQARELARCFKVIAAWARDLCGRLHQAQDGTIREAEEFKAKFLEAELYAEKCRKQLQDNLDEAKASRAKAEADESFWTSSVVATSWIPVIGGIFSVIKGMAKQNVNKRRELEDEAERQFMQAKNELEQKTSQREQAEFIAGKAGDLVKTLKNLESVSEAIATFWMMEADKFDAQGAKMKTSQAERVEAGMRSRAAKNNIRFWKEAKKEIDLYAEVMTAINNSFNFPTKATRPDAQCFTLPHVDLTLTIPASINLKAITSA